MTDNRINAQDQRSESAICHVLSYIITQDAITRLSLRTAWMTVMWFVNQRRSRHSALRSAVGRVHVAIFMTPFHPQQSARQGDVSQSQCSVGPCHRLAVGCGVRRRVLDTSPASVCPDTQLNTCYMQSSCSPCLLPDRNIRHVDVLDNSLTLGVQWVLTPGPKAVARGKTQTYNNCFVIIFITVVVSELQRTFQILDMTI